MDRGDQLDVPGLVMEQVAQRFFLKNINFNPVFCSFVQRQLLFMFFSFFNIKASWRSSFTVVNKAFMPKY